LFTSHPITPVQEVGRALARIPDIYRSLDTIALMPGAICGCLKKFIDTAVDLNQDQTRIRAFILVPGNCGNAPGLNSYFDRLWTWQEFMYSKRTTVLRTSRTPAKCVRKEADVKHLERFAALRHQRQRNEGLSESHALREISWANHRLVENGIKLMGAYRAGASLTCNCKESCTCEEVSSIKMLFRFLLGQTIENSRRQSERNTDEREELILFLHHLQVLGESGWKSSNPQDSVLAVGVDCPRYTPPVDSKNMGLPALLEDTILQFERNFRQSPATHAPAGLFGSRDGPAL